MWNHIMRYNTRGFRGFVDSAATAADGSFVVQRDYVELAFMYNNPDATVKSLNGMNLYAFKKTVAPPNLAGEAHLLHVPIDRSEEHTSELQSLMRISYAVFCLKKKNNIQHIED